MDWIVNALNDPFVGLGILGVLSAYFWLIQRRDPKPPKTRMPTVEEAKALGIPLDMRSFYTIEVNAPASKSNAPASKVSVPVSLPVQPAQPAVKVQSMNLSTIAADAGPVNVLIAGPKGSGKTTVLRTIITRRNAELIALDPHNSPGKWPCSVVGGGLNWTAIDGALRTMSAEMQRRFVQLDRGEIREGEFPLRVYVGDEFLSISQELDGRGAKAHAGKSLIERLVNGRKVGECIMIASQNDTVEALGIQGNADLKGCFDYIIYLGALVSTRAKFHGCPLPIIEAAMRQPRVGVVWHPERNNWYALVYDLAPVLEGDMLSVTTSPASSTSVVGHIPVSDEVPVLAVSLPDTAHDTGIAGIATDPILSDTDIRRLYNNGLSKNKIAERLAGKKQDRLARIAAAIGDDDGEPTRALTV